MALPGDKDLKVGSVQFPCWLAGNILWGNCFSLCTMGSGPSLPCQRLGWSENEPCRSAGHLLLEGGCVTEGCASVSPVSLGSCSARAQAIAKLCPAGLKKVKCIFHQDIPQNTEQEHWQHPSDLSSFGSYTCLKNPAVIMVCWGNGLMLGSLSQWSWWHVKKDQVCLDKRYHRWWENFLRSSTATTTTAANTIATAPSLSEQLEKLLWIVFP